MLPLRMFGSCAWFLIAVPAAALAQEVASPTEVHFEYHQRLVFLTASVNGSERSFLLDTGANTSVVDSKTAAELELPLGEATEVDGILGSDFLAQRVLCIDFPGRRLTLSEGPLEADAAALPLELDLGIPRIQAQLDDLPVALRIDTGASLFDSKDVYVNVTSALWEDLRRANPALEPAGTLSGSGTGGAVVLPFARIRSLQVGSTTTARPYVIVQPRQGYVARPDAVGFVGNNFLEKLGEVTLDYPGRQWWPGPRRG